MVKIIMVSTAILLTNYDHSRGLTGNEELLLIKRENIPYRGWWAFPGGKVEPGETGFQALQREIWEETGLKIQHGTLCTILNERLLENHKLLYHFLLQYWIVPVNDSIAKQVQHKHSKEGVLTWYPINHLPEIVPSDYQVFNDCLLKNKTPCLNYVEGTLVQSPGKEKEDLTLTQWDIQNTQEGFGK